jgi:hypothetical protein
VSIPGEPGAYQPFGIGVGARQHEQRATRGSAEHAGDRGAIADVDAMGHVPGEVFVQFAGLVTKS